MSNSLGVLGVGVLISYGIRGISSIHHAQRELNNLFFKTKDGTRTLTDLGNAVVKLGSAMLLIKAGTASMEAALGTIADYADYEEKMLDLAGLMGRSRDDMGMFTDAAQQMAMKYAYTTEEIAEGMWWLSSAGLSEQSVLEALEPSIRWATIGHMSLQEAVQGFTTILVSFAIPAEDYASTVDMMTKAMSLYRIEMSDFEHSFGTFGMMARASNQSLEEVTALWGTFINQGLSPSRAGMMVKMLLTSLMGSSAESRRIMDSLNVDIIDAEGNFRSILDIVEDVNAALEDPTKAHFLASLVNDSAEAQAMLQDEREGALLALSTLFGRRAVAGALSIDVVEIPTDPRYAGLVGPELIREQERLILQAAEEGFATGYLENVTSGINYTLENIKTTFKTVKQIIGDNLFGEDIGPILGQINEFIGSVGEYLRSNPEIAKLIGIGLLAFGLIAILSGVIIAATFVFTTFGTIITGVLSAAIPIIGWALAAIIGIGGIIALVVTYGEEILGVLTEIWDWIYSEIVKPLMDLSAAMWEVVRPIQEFLVNYVFAPLVGSVIPAIMLVLTAISLVVGFLLIGIRTIWAIIQVVIAAITAVFTGDWEAFKESLDRIWESLSTDIASIGKLFFDTIVGAIAGIGKDLVGYLFGGNVTSGGASIAEPADVTVLRGGNAASLAAVNIVSRTGSAFAAPGTPLMANASGINRVLKDGWYRLHEDETVSRANRNRFLNEESSQSAGSHFQFGNINITLQGSSNNEDDARRIARMVKDRIEEEMARVYRGKKIC